MSNKVKGILLGVGTVLCVILTVVFRIQSDHQELSYEEVKAIVATSEMKEYRSGGKTVRKPYVTVTYAGETYELKNIYDSYSYRPGATVTVYKSGNKLYANEAGVRTSTPVFYAYFVFLLASFVLFISFLCSIPKMVKKKEQE